MLDLQGLLTIPFVDPYYGFDIARSGDSVAYSANGAGRWEIVLAPAGSEPKGAKSCTAGIPGAKFAPRWSPGGERLLYVRDLDGGEQYDLFIHDLRTGEHANLTPDTPEAIYPTCSWSPDGRWIAFASNRSGSFDTYVMASSGGPARRVLGLSFQDWEMHWSPDSKQLAVVSEAEGQDFAVHVVSLGESQAHPIVEGQSRICAKDVRWSPDGERLAFASDTHGCFDIGVYELASGRVRWLTEGPGDKETPTWSPDGALLAYVERDGPASIIAVLDQASGRVSHYQVGVGVHHAPRFSPDGAHLWCIFENPRHPSDLWRIRLEDALVEQMSHSLPPGWRSDLFVMPSHVRYPGQDGEPVPSLLFRPPGELETLPPAVVVIHGGPNWISQVCWDPLIQHMVSRGWVVLAPNYRGSIGYGRDWQLASRFDLGGVDTDDVSAGWGYLVDNQLADPARVALTGRSWGGYLTMTGLTRHPDRWAAGAAVVPFLNWFTGHANSREDLQHWDRENFGDPVKDHDLYYERSPFFFLDRVQAPVQLISGAHDVRCPASESTQAREALLAMGKECELVLYEDEGHSFLKRENVIDAEKRRVAFLAQVLENG